MYERVTLKEVLEDNPDILQWTLDFMKKYMPLIIGAVVVYELVEKYIK